MDHSLNALSGHYKLLPAHHYAAFPAFTGSISMMKDYTQSYLTNNEISYNSINVLFLIHHSSNNPDTIDWSILYQPPTMDRSMYFRVIILMMLTIPHNSMKSCEIQCVLFILCDIHSIIHSLPHHPKCTKLFQSYSSSTTNQNKIKSNRSTICYE